ncbi:rhodanese-like domain-containing protein [bacterium]|nr:rhodanese-like domain-containing protein [bacterium]
MRRSFPFLALALTGLLFAGCGSGDQQSSGAGADAISGRIEDGLRVLTFDAEAKDQHFRIYRGDYVRPELEGGGSFTLVIPGLGVDLAFPPADPRKDHFKVPDAGTFAFTIGEAAGVIEAIEYQASSYREVNSRDAAALIANLDPLILDVRTPREFQDGHIEGAVLIPVQQFQRRISEIAEHKNDPVFVYCRTGNRSTVAAKMMIDAGFTNVINLRRGIVEWSREGLPVTR